MADISKINPNGDIYDIKDATARAGLNLKADKVSNATANNFAGLDSNGNLTDSGKKASDFMASDGVIANPQGTVTGTLTKLGIGSDIYEIQGGSGGEYRLLTGTLLANAWSNNTQTVTIQGISSTTNGVIGLLDSATSTQIESAKSSEINVTTIGTNSVSFVCKNVPTVDIPFGVLIGGGGSGASALTDLTDVDISNPTDGQVLQYDAENQKWVNGAGGILPPHGGSVTPTDVIQTWLNCANIWDKTYTTIGEVLADSTTLLALISSNNAADYMARSTTWASAVTANSTAMSLIGLSDYCANALLNDSTWATAICNSTYFESVLNVKVPTMSNYTVPEGTVIYSNVYNSTYAAWKAFNGTNSSNNDCWLARGSAGMYVGYIFTFPVCINKVIIGNRNMGGSPQGNAIITFEIQATNDDTWVTLGSFTNENTNPAGESSFVISNNTLYSKYRLYVLTTYNNTQEPALGKLQFYGRA